MKILHTSDWHLGHTLFGYDRTEEQEYMLQQMVEITKNEQPDLFLLCGDVFHTAQPTAAAQTMLNHTIVDLHNACPEMKIVMTAGNHDSGTKHEIFRTPWEYFNVYMIGNLKKDDLQSHIIKIKNKGLLVAVPYTHERNIKDGVVRLLLEQAMKQNTQELPIILSAHTSIIGAIFKGHDNSDEKTIGGIDTISIEDIGSSFDYLALGHIHHPQFIHLGNHNIRYSGSPLPISFDENYQHSVSIVEIYHHGEKPNVRTVDIKNLRPLTTLPIEGYASWKQVRDELAAFPANLRNYIRLNVQLADVLPSEANNEARLLTENKQCRFCLINWIRPEHDNERINTEQLTLQEFQTIRPIDVATRFAEDKGEVFDQDMQSMFDQVLRIINQEEREQ